LVTFAGLTLVIVACGAGDKAKLPDDKALFERGQKAEAAMQYAAAVDSYMTLVDNYPQSPFRYKALFMAAFIQFEYLKDNARTIEICTRLIDEYPNCDLADDAAMIREAAVAGRDLMSVIEDSLKTK
jgi:outer membrane protein assembly factor BamD (BamD/ComL family)